MSIIALPDDRWTSIDWRFVDPAQVNRSEFTGARQVVSLPGAAHHRVQARHAPLVGEAQIRAWRKFFRQLKGPVNTFRLPATSAAQHALADPVSANGGVPTLANIANVLVETVGGASLRRTAVGTGSWDGAARSTSSTGPGAALSFRPAQANKGVMVGFNTNPTTSAGYTDMPFAWYCKSDGTCAAVELGVVTDLGSYSANDDFGLSYATTTKTIRYVHNGVVAREVAGPASASYFLDSSFFEPLSVTHISFGAAGGAGWNSLPLKGLPASATLMPAGCFVTVPLVDGTEQLVVLTADLAADANGRGNAIFEPALRRDTLPGATVKCASPTCLVAMDGDELGYSVEVGAVFGFEIAATEAY